MSDQMVAYRGLIKLRLVHTSGRSLLLPDHIVVQDQGTYWLQPQWVLPSLLVLDEPGSTSILVDVASRLGHSVTVRVEVQGDGLVASLRDRSQTYRCTVYGPQNLALSKAGQCRVRDDGGVDLRLYHHTSKHAKPLILTSGSIWGSAWNFQGNKELDNCAYAYFTSLDRIESEQDLQRIAMSGTAKLPLRLDQSPNGAPPDLVLDVYRERTENRVKRISLWVPAEDVSPSHVFEHHSQGVAYEVAHPWIYRVGLRPGATYGFVGNVATPNQDGLKRFDYLVLGDCRTPAGLAAPYDEEVTGEMFEIQDLDGSTVFEFWHDHHNETLLTGELETQKFSSPDA